MTINQVSDKQIVNNIIANHPFQNEKQRHVIICISTDLDSGNLAQELEDILGITLIDSSTVPRWEIGFEDIEDNSYRGYIQEDHMPSGVLSSQSFEYSLYINKRSGPDELEERIQYGKRLFELLKKTNRFGLLLTLEMETIYDEYIPTDSEQGNKD